MKITKVSFRRIKSINYQSIGAECEITLVPGDDYKEAYSLARVIVNDQLGEGATETEVQKAKSILEQVSALEAFTKQK